MEINKCTEEEAIKELERIAEDGQITGQDIDWTDADDEEADEEDEADETDEEQEEKDDVADESSDESAGGGNGR